MQWVKLWVSLRKNTKFRRLSQDAKVAFVCALMTAADYETDGAIRLSDGPLTAKEMAEDELLVPEKRLPLVLSELQNQGLITVGNDGIPVVNRFAEKAGEHSHNRSNAERQARHREKQRRELEALQSSVTSLQEALRNGVTSPVTVTRYSVTDKEEEVELEIDLPNPSVDKSTSGLGPARTQERADASWVPGVESAVKPIAKATLRGLTADQRFDAGRYMALKFANCTKNERKNRRQGAAFAKGLAEMATAAHYGDLTFSQYVGLCQTLSTKLNGPFYQAWDVKAVVEWE